MVQICFAAARSRVANVFTASRFHLVRRSTKLESRSPDVGAVGRFALQTGGKGAFALVRVAYTDDPAAPGGQVAPEAEDRGLDARGLLAAAVQLG